MRIVSSLFGSGFAGLGIAKVKGLSADNRNNLEPKLPSREKESLFSVINSSVLPHAPPNYDIKHSNTQSEYFFEWSVGDLQCDESRTSFTQIFLRTESIVDIHIKIYCDELSKPIYRIYKISPASDSFEFNIGLLMSDNKTFLNAIDDKIMDGYLTRLFLREYENFMSLQSDKLPK